MAVTDRWMTPDDLPLLAISLAKDEHHQGTDPDFFTQPGTVTKVYSDEDGPICFVRGSKALRLDIQYLDNHDRKRNMKAMLGGFYQLAKQAKENGFSEITFQTDNAMLRRFCQKAFGFVESQGELRRLL